MSFYAPFWSIPQPLDGIKVQVIVVRVRDDYHVNLGQLVEYVGQRRITVKGQVSVRGCCIGGRVVMGAGCERVAGGVGSVLKTHRQGPMYGSGSAREEKIGSVRMLTSPIWTRNDACPIHVVVTAFLREET